MSNVFNSARNFRAWIRTLEAELPPGKAWVSRIGEIIVDPYLTDGRSNANEYRSIRRNLSGQHQTLPSGEIAYDIGEACHTLGIKWCSGLFALFQHDKEWERIFSVLDHVAQKRGLRQHAWAWFRTARLNLRNEILQRNGFPHYDMTTCRQLLQETTVLIHEMVCLAWAENRNSKKQKTMRPKGPFSTIKEIFENPTFSTDRTAMAEFLIVGENRRQEEIDPSLFRPIIQAEAHLAVYRFAEMRERLRLRQATNSSTRLDAEYDDVLFMLETLTKKCLQSPGFARMLELAVQDMPKLKTITTVHEDGFSVEVDLS